MFSFFVYSLPINCASCLLLYFLFLATVKFKISQLFRKFYFFKATLLQTIFEGSISYFVYVCFGHLSMAFAFGFADKAALMLTVAFLWGLLAFSLTFYLLIGYFLGAKAYHFLYCMYRVHESYIFITAKMLLRNFVRGAIFFFLHDFYEIELLLLSAVELAVILAALALETRNRIFVSKTFYCLWLFYHFSFILLNTALHLTHVYEK